MKGIKTQTSDKWSEKTGRVRYSKGTSKAILPDAVDKQHGRGREGWIVEVVESARQAMIGASTAVGGGRQEDRTAERRTDARCHWNEAF
jgi:hypothetical protein